MQKPEAPFYEKTVVESLGKRADDVTRCPVSCGGVFGPAGGCEGFQKYFDSGKPCCSAARVNDGAAEGRLNRCLAQSARRVPTARTPITKLAMGWPGVPPRGRGGAIAAVGR
jgi:hypothetical protein